MMEEALKTVAATLVEIFLDLQMYLWFQVLDERGQIFRIEFEFLSPGVHASNRETGLADFLHTGASMHHLSLLSFGDSVPGLRLQ